MYVLLLLLISIFLESAEADEIWTRYDIGANVAINSISNYENYLWVGTANGILRLDRINVAVKTFSTKDGLPGNYVSSICCDKNGLVYSGVKVFDSEGRTIAAPVICIDGDSLRSYLSELLLPHTNSDFGDSIFYAKPNDIPSIIKGNNNIIYVASNYWFAGGGHYYAYVGRIYKFNGYSWENIFERYFDDSKSEITCMAVSENNELSYGFNTFSPFGEKAMAFDKKGGLWSSHPMDQYPPHELADYRWVQYFLNGKSANYDSTNSALSSNVYSIIVDGNDTAWFGGEKLVSFNGSEWNVYSADTWSVTNKINALSIDDDGFLWVGTQAHGLWRFDAKNATIVQSVHEQPTEFTLSSTYPNPFNAQTTISFDLTKPSKVNLSIYSLTGQKIREIAAGNYIAGKHTLIWDGKNEQGENVSSGLYLARMESCGVSKVVRMAMVK